MIKRVVVVLENRIYVYNFMDLKLVDAINTSYNAKGLCALSPDANRTVLACPDIAKGHVKVMGYERNQTLSVSCH